MGCLDPVGLADLAAAIRDGEPRDLKVVGQKLVEHCTVEAIIVRRDAEEVEVKQKGFIHRFDADGIMWVKPAMFEDELVDPIPVVAPEGVVPTQEQIETLVRPKVMETVAFTTSITIDQIDYSKNKDMCFTPQRYTTMRLLYELTDLSTNAIPPLIGYRSPMPFQSCMMEMRRARRGQGNPPNIWGDEQIRNMVDLVRMGTGAAWRRPESAGREYCVCP